MGGCPDDYGAMQNFLELLCSAYRKIGGDNRGWGPLVPRGSQSTVRVGGRNVLRFAQDTDDTMIKNFEDMQKLGQTNVDSAMRVLGEWNKNWQAIAAEMSDYTKRSFEESTATMEKLMASKSVEQAVEIQTSYAKRAYDDYMQQVTKIGGMYANMAKEAYKPVEKILQNGA
jgi:hypothetical protein